MKLFVSVTDKTWFDFLANRKPIEVNFWRPLARTEFRALDLGEPFLFKLHSPNNAIVGGGFFTSHARLPLTMAWDAFGQNNGAPDFQQFQVGIAEYRKKRGLDTHDPEIGCIVLSDPFFLEEKDWIPVPADWSPNIVTGKQYDTLNPTGQELWERVMAFMPSRASVVRETPLAAQPVFGSQYLRTARLGQGAFRVVTLNQFRKTCCITGEKTVPVLEAAHIMPVSEYGTHSATNSLLLRSDMHTLFDRGLIGITPEYKIRVSSQIRDLYSNGRVYYAREGESLKSLPPERELRPNPELLEWHLNQVFIP